jgi:cobalt/nickel transport system ATP-binding protein
MSEPRPGSGDGAAAGSAGREAVVRVSCVRHTYPDSTQVHLCGLDFVVERGQRVVVLGPNGCGKSTLLFHILGLLESQEGEVSVFGVNPARHFNRIRERVGVVLQNVDEQLIAPTVWDDVSFSPRSYGYLEPEVDVMVERALGRVGIAHLRHKVCHYLSGGEKRKVALAGAMVLDPELLVLDEPFEGLDPASRADLVQLLAQLQREQGVTLVMATHDVNVVKAMADVVYVLVGGGEIVAQGSPETIFRDPALLRSSNIEPPVLAELFERLEQRGLALGRPLSLDDAARVILDWAARQARGARAPAAAATEQPALPLEGEPGRARPASGDPARVGREGSD